MKKVLILILVVCIFIISCSSKEYVCPNGNVVDDVSKCVQDKQVPVPVVEISEPVVEEITISPEIKELFSQQYKIKSLTYKHKESLDVTKPIYPVYLKENLMKILLPGKNKLLNQNDLDTVIIDINSKSVNGYCESEKYCSKQGDMGQVDYDTYYKKTPFDWVNEVNEAELLVGQRIFGRDTMKVKVNGDYTYWVDAFYGIPLKVEGNGVVFIYDEIIFNSVRFIAFETRD
jgi:hypothetical protein